jgi:hypothetical protein
MDDRKLSNDAQPQAEDETLPEATAPETTEPEATEPETTEPEATEPEAPAEAGFFQKVLAKIKAFAGPFGKFFEWFRVRVNFFFDVLLPQA